MKLYEAFVQLFHQFFSSIMLHFGLFEVSLGIWCSIVASLSVFFQTFSRFVLDVVLISSNEKTV